MGEKNRQASAGNQVTWMVMPKVHYHMKTQQRINQTSPIIYKLKKKEKKKKENDNTVS